MSNETREQLELDELRIRTQKLQEEVLYIRIQRALYPVVVASGLLAALIAFVKLVLQ